MTTSHSCLFTLSLLVFFLVGINADAQIVSVPALRAPAVPAEDTRASITQPLNDGTGRTLTLRRLKPAVVPPEPVASPIPPSTPAQRAARLAAWRATAPVHRRLLSLTAITHPTGLTFIQWMVPGPTGKVELYEAWTQTDFRSLWMVRTFTLGSTQYDIFPVVIPATNRWNLSRPAPGPITFPEGTSTPGFRLIKGDPTHLECLAPIIHLHKIYAENGPQIHALWQTATAEQAARAAALIANPPPVEDITISVTYLKSNLFPEAEAEVKAATRASGKLVPQPEPAK